MSQTYNVGLVGESNYQRAIAQCREGETVFLFRQPDNPYDERAIVVVSGRGATIGYIGRDSFLHRAVHDEDQGCTAEIVAIRDGGKRMLGVVIAVELCVGPLDEREYSPA